MKYIVIQRGSTNAEWLIRVLDSGDTEILERADQYDGSFVNNPFYIEHTSYFWAEWADKDLFERVWINDEQGNANDVTMTDFTIFEKAFEYLQSISHRY